MGAVRGGECIAQAGELGRFGAADQLAATPGLAPVLHQSGKVHVQFQRRPTGGNKDLKRVVDQSAFCSLGSPARRTFHARNRSQGKRHQLGLIYDDAGDLGMAMRHFRDSIRYEGDGTGPLQ